MTAFDWHYGPTSDDPDPGSMWHRGCGGRVYGFKEGFVCASCGKGDGGPDDATILSAAHLTLLRHIAAGVVKAMRRADGVVQVWVDGVHVEHLGGVYSDLVDARYVTQLPAVAPKAKPITPTGAGLEWLAQNESENAA